MTYLPRILMFLAAVLLASLFIWPMWSITLLAPQYPDGVQMHIYVDKIGGSSPGTLQNVNILNHYIGMKKIEPDSIPELKYMPPIVIFFMVTALLAAILDRKMIYAFWGILLLLVFLVGMYDFYLWEYDYGHDLDPNAPMIFEGASFQPPLIGRKEILNFTAISLPHIGGWLAGTAMMFSFLAYWIKSKVSIR